MCSRVFPRDKSVHKRGAPAGQPIRDWLRYMLAIDELRRQMVLLPTDYLRGANGTNRKLAPYISVRVVKYLPDRQDLCIDLQKRDGHRKISPYHPNAKDNVDLVRQPLPIEEGAWCHYPDAVQQELGCICGPITRTVHGWWRLEWEQ